MRQTSSQNHLSTAPSFRFTVSLFRSQVGLPARWALHHGHHRHRQALGPVPAAPIAPSPASSPEPKDCMSFQRPHDMHLRICMFKNKMKPGNGDICWTMCFSFKMNFKFQIESHVLAKKIHFHQTDVFPRISKVKIESLKETAAAHNSDTIFTLQSTSQNPSMRDVSAKKT